MLMASVDTAVLPKTLLAVRYACFAAIATIANIGMQAVTFRLSPFSPLAVSLVAGTIVGFAVKYILDKYWIFFDDFSSYGHEARKVTLYGLFGIAMTFVFWGTELTSLAIWHTMAAKYIGGTLGLAFGYTAKYLLDRRFVFGDRNR
jgi:putative flippase GtrA